jgi:DNA-nicking Smr family endonuclease
MGKRRPRDITGGEPDYGNRLRFAVPVASVDLHGLRVDEARRKLEAFLQRVARTHSGQVVRVITGKGRNSPDGPVLLPMVLEELSYSHDLVAEWETSMDGGSVLIRLR